jgi:hypothetical protein
MTTIAIYGRCRMTMHDIYHVGMDALFSVQETPPVLVDWLLRHGAIADPPHRTGGYLRPSAHAVNRMCSLLTEEERPQVARVTSTRQELSDQERIRQLKSQRDALVELARTAAQWLALLDVGDSEAQDEKMELMTRLDRASRTRRIP